MKIACIIPSRYASTRLPGKPLRMIAGKTLVRRVYERAILAMLPDVVIRNSTLMKTRHLHVARMPGGD